MSQLEAQKESTSLWFKQLRDHLCRAFETLEQEYTTPSAPPGTFERKAWAHPQGGGGEMSIMHGRVFEKVGVNISTVFGHFDEKFAKEIPGAEEDPRFFATGISLVAHPCSPLVPAAHMNTRFIVTTKSWFGGGADLTPIYPNERDTTDFHEALKAGCDQYNLGYYPKFKQWCDEYFYLPHRKEARGIGGIFYDQLNTGHFENDFAFTQTVGNTFLSIYPELIRRHLHKTWSPEQRASQLAKRGRYVEFNLLYDRGTRFGLMTGGNVEAILMSLPPAVTW